MSVKSPPRRPFGFCFSPFVDEWTLDGLKALAQIGLNAVRMSFGLCDLCGVSTDPNKWRWDVLDPFIDACLSVGITTINANTDGGPAWALEGDEASKVPADCEALVRSIWWNVPDAKHPVTGHPDQFAHGVHDFNQDPARKDETHDEVTGRLITGAELAAIDQQQSPRPWLNNPPKVSRKFTFDAFAILAKRWGEKVFIWSYGNEPGAFSVPTMRLYDIAFGGTEDTIATRFFPDGVVPAFEGLFSVLPKARTLGIDADSDAIYDRCCATESKFGRELILSFYNYALGEHTYGDFNGISYQTSEAFKAVYDKWSHGGLRQRWCSEIGTLNRQSIDWFKTKGRAFDAIFWLGQPLMPKPVPDVNAPLLKEFAAELAKVGPVSPVRGGQQGRHRPGRKP